jgi:hypothetical protein
MIKNVILQTTDESECCFRKTDGSSKRYTSGLGSKENKCQGACTHWLQACLDTGAVLPNIFWVADHKCNFFFSGAYINLSGRHFMPELISKCKFWWNYPCFSRKIIIANLFKNIGRPVFRKNCSRTQLESHCWPKTLKANDFMSVLLIWCNEYSNQSANFVAKKNGNEVTNGKDNNIPY